MYKIKSGGQMNLAFLELSSCILRAKQNKKKGLKESCKYGSNTERQTELYEQWILKNIQYSKF